MRQLLCERAAINGIEADGVQITGQVFRIPAKEMMYSDLMPIIYRAQRGWQSYVEPLLASG